MASSKDLILENAKQLFAENGFKGTTIAQIAKTSNVTDAAIYRHYKSKQQIFDVIVETFLADYRVPVFGRDVPDEGDMVFAARSVEQRLFGELIQIDLFGGLLLQSPE